MAKSGKVIQQEVFLGIEGGGTKTTAIAQEVAGGKCHELRAGPANLRLLSDRQLVERFREFQRTFSRVRSLAVGLAGARTETDRQRIRRAAAQLWPDVSCHATNDLETALAAAGESGEWGEGGGKKGKSRHHGARSTQHVSARVLVLSGTGSCCYGRVGRRTAKIGGWGHVLGDKGSGYEIGLRALKAAVFYLDRDGEWSQLGRRLLRALQLNEPDDLIAWVQHAGKDEVAALAVEVFAAWARRDRIATDILNGAAASLAKDAAACAQQLAGKGATVQFVFSGGVLLKQPRFAALVARELRRLWPRAIITPLTREGAWGALALARSKFKVQSSKFEANNLKPALDRERSVQSLTLSPTEQRNPRSMNLDRLSVRAAIDLMLTEEAKVPSAIHPHRRKIERTIQMIVRAFRRGGRLFYVGAGTSGRLGVLDASECPPTFRTPPELVQGIMAGGQRALWSAVEGAEDAAEAGARAVTFRGVTKRDVIVGIAASGRTPFVWGALREARRRGVQTVLLCFNPKLKISPGDRPTLVIAPDTGPEILTGSTRLKAGTATKLILNMLTTLAMVRLGKVRENLMIDVNASNAKLRDRATRIVQELSGANYETAQTALADCGWQIRPACARLRRRVKN